MPDDVTLDMITRDSSSDEYVVYLVEDGPWPSSHEEWQHCLKRIQDRILGAVDVVAHDKLPELCREAAGKAIRIQVDSPRGQPEQLSQLLAAVREYLTERNDLTEALKTARTVAGLRIVSGQEMGRFQSLQGYLTALREVILSLADHGDWQQAYMRLPQDNLRAVEFEAVVAELDELGRLGELPAIDLPSDTLPIDADAVAFARCRDELFEAVFASRDAQRFLLEVLSGANGSDGNTPAENSTSAWSAKVARIRELLERTYADDSSARSDSSVAQLIKDLNPSASHVGHTISKVLVVQGSIDQGHAIDGIANKLAAYCDVKERVMARYFGYVILSVLGSGHRAVLQDLARVGIHALSTAVDTLAAKANNIRPRHIMWCVDERVQSATLELRGLPNAEMLRRIADARRACGAGAAAKEVADHAGLDVASYKQAVDAIQSPTAKSSAALIGWPITREPAT